MSVEQLIKERQELVKKHQEILKRQKESKATDKHCNAFVETATDEALKILNERRSIDTVDSRISTIEDEEVQTMVKLFIYSSYQAKNVVGVCEASQKQIIDYNHALRNSLLDFHRSSLTPRYLIDKMAEFNISSGVFNNDPTEQLTEVFGQDFIGMWNEQAFANFLCAANIKNFDATSEQDNQGIDVFVCLDPSADSDNECWAPTDVKSSVSGLSRQKEKRSDIAYSDISRLSSRSQACSSANKQASYDNPIINIMHSDKRFVLAVDYGVNPSKFPCICPPIFYNNVNGEVLTDLAGQLVSYMKNAKTQKIKEADFKPKPIETAQYLGHIAV